MSESTVTDTTITQGDAALAWNTAAASSDTSSSSNDDEGGGEDPVMRGRRLASASQMYRPVVPPVQRGRTKSGHRGPTSSIPNLTPGARRIP